MATSSGSTGRRHGAEPWRRSPGLLLTIVGMIVGAWLLLHRLLLEAHRNTEGSLAGRAHKSVGEQTQHLKALLAETTALLHDVMSSNLTAASSEVLRAPQTRAHAEVSRLPVLLGAEEKQATKCAAEKHDVMLELQQCRKEASSKQPAPAQGWGTGLFNTNAPPPPPPPPSLSSPAAAGAQRWLVIGIPTIARAHDEDYLLTSLRSVADLLPSDPADLLYGQVRTPSQS